MIKIVLSSGFYYHSFVFPSVLESILGYDAVFYTYMIYVGLQKGIFYIH